ncbi:MAG: Ig-like domain-containing protein, partial [Acidobacteria bacterium]|nr:Ig-like domain-containing protein [Acidobacteriota bacterium]
SWSTQGSYTLTCIVRDAQGVSATASRTVTVVRAPTLTITPGNPVLYKGGSVLLRVFMNTLQTTNTTVTIVSADTNIATVTPSVLIPPGDNSTLFEVEAKTVGATRITASLPAALGGGSASTTVTVTAGPLISITPLAAYVALGGSFDYTLTISDKQATNTSISLSSLNILVASLPPTVVLPAGALSVSFPVKGEALGTTTIKAALPPELGGTSVTAAFTVGTSTFPRLTLSPTSLTLAPGETGRVTATLSTAIDGGVTVTLASSNPSVATVPASVPITPVNLTASFDVKALAPGVTTLTATLPANLGSGSWTLPVQVTGCAAAGAPTISVGPPRIPGGSNLLVKWTAASNLAGSYLLEASTNASFTAPLFFTARTKALSALVPTSSVSSEQVLYVRVKAIQDCGTVTPSAVVTVRLSPAIARFLFTRGAAPLGARVGGTPPSTTVVVRNAGGASGKITLLARGSFFDVSPVEAEVPAGGETTLTLTARASALTAPAALVGALEGSSGNQKIATSVSLTVTAQEPGGNAGRKARATATTVLFQAPEGQNPAPQTIDVAIPGLAAGQSLELAPRIGPGGNWLDVTGSFVVPPSGTVRLTLSVDRSRRTESDGPTPPYRTLLTLQPVGAAPEDAAVIEVLDAPRPNVTAGGGRTRRPGSPGDADRLVSPALTGGSFIVPVCVKSGGSFGAAFFSDGWVRNITSEPVAADFYYTPDGKDGLTDSGVLKSTITIPGSTTVRLSDMLAALFDVTGSGQVELRTASPEALTLRTAVESVTGGDPALRFGTEIPTVASGSGTGRGLSPLVIPGIRGDATFRTNLLLAETTGAPVDVLISVYDALGTRLGSTTASVPAYGKVQINGLVSAVSAGATLALGSAEVSVTAGSGRVVPLATVLDNRSNSFSALRGNTVGGEGARSALDLPTSYAVPAAVRTLGAFNTQFLTGLTLVNGVGSPARLTLSYIYVDQDDFNQVKTVAKDVTIPGRGSLPVDKADDVILNLFGVGNRSY